LSGETGFFLFAVAGDEATRAEIVGSIKVLEI
jgi:hypothetical protein